MKIYNTALNPCLFYGYFFRPAFSVDLFSTDIFQTTAQLISSTEIKFAEEK